jgi:Holliday junction resolvase
MSNYRRGAELERDLVNQLRADGWEAARSAGSKSAVDVWAVRAGVVRLFQCTVAKSLSSKRRDVAAATLRLGHPVELVTPATLVELEEAA